MIFCTDHSSDSCAAYSDAFARVQQAAIEFGCDSTSLHSVQTPSDKDMFFEARSANGQALFFKAHLGSTEQLRAWSEPESARWAERVGCGAKVFATHVDGVLVTERLAGRSMTREEGQEEFFVRQVAHELFRLHDAESHGLRAQIPCTTGGVRARIGKALQTDQVGFQLAAEILRKADWIDAQFAGFTIDFKRRFGDCYYRNWVVVEKKLWAIDLADSDYGDPMADLARYAYCEGFNHEQLQSMLQWYSQNARRFPSAEESRRLYLHAIAQDLDYFTYFASRSGVSAPETKRLAERILADEALDSRYPRACFDEVFHPR